MNPMAFDSFVKMCRTRRLPYFACRFEKRFVCVLCDKILENSHRKGHKELSAARAPFGSECNICSRVFKNRNSLGYHKRKYHSDMKVPIEEPEKRTIEEGRKVPVAVELDVLQPDRMSQQVDGMDKNGFQNDQKTEELDIKNTL